MKSLPATRRKGPVDEAHERAVRGGAHSSSCGDCVHYSFGSQQRKKPQGCAPVGQTTEAVVGNGLARAGILGFHKSNKWAKVSTSIGRRF
ncbi:MAG: hypothetical protein ACJASX_004167 [Limisphaerales bacterium]